MSAMVTDRDAVLAAAVTEQIKRGWRVESQIGNRVILAKGGTRKAHQHAHLAISLLTCGLWLPVYFMALIKARQFRARRQAVCIDQFGNVQLLPL